MYGSGSPKRHRGYSNNRMTAVLDLGPYRRHMQQSKKVTTVHKYENKDGKLSYVGTPALKGTQSVP